MQSPPHSHVLPKPGLGRQGRKSSTHRCCTRSPQQAGASIRNTIKASWRVSLLDFNCQINHFGGCGLPVLFFSPVSRLRWASACFGWWRVFRLCRFTPLYNRSTVFFPVARKKFFWCGLPFPVALPLPVGLGWLVAPLPGCPVRLLLTPSYNRFPVVFPDVFKKNIYSFLMNI